MNEDFRPFTVTKGDEPCAICDRTYKVGDVMRRGFGNDLVCDNETCTAEYETAYNAAMSRRPLDEAMAEITKRLSK